MTTIQIQEFSTGIRYQTYPDGTWVSLGFTGQYINVTDPNIPQEIIRAIANKDFAVAERGLGHDPAIIGREIVRTTDDCWSVIAVVSQGQDEKGRSGSFYRFFWCEGLNLASIIKWMSNYQQKYNHQPIFNPSEQPGETVNYQIIRQEGKSSSSKVGKTLDTLSMVLEPDDPCDLIGIHSLAIDKANGQPVSWAINAEGLEKPWNFMVIKASSQRAYQTFKKSIANQPKDIVPAAFDEQALKSAIKTLIGSSTIKKEAIGTFIEALGVTEISEAYWESLFDTQGAQNAITQNIYTSQMVRLLTLKLIAIPNFLEEYLKWIGIGDIANRKANDQINYSLEFQSKIEDEIQNSQATKNRLIRILNDVTKIDKSSKISEQIGDYLKSSNPNSSLATLYYRISAYITRESIPKSIWDKAFANSPHSSETVFGRKIYKQQRSSEVSQRSAIIFTITSFILGAFFGVGGSLLFQVLNTKDSPVDNNIPKSIKTPKSKMPEVQKTVTPTPLPSQPTGQVIPKPPSNPPVDSGR